MKIQTRGPNHPGKGHLGSGPLGPRTVLAETVSFKEWFLTTIILEIRKLTALLLANLQ